MERARLRDFPALVIQRLCDFSKPSDLQKYRLVSRSWNRVVSNHSSFQDCVATFGKDWEKQAEIIDITSATHWKHLVLVNLSLSKQKYLYRFWEENLAHSVRTLTLDYLHTGCTELANLINLCTVLQELTLNQVNFVPIHQIVETMPGIPQNHHHHDNEVPDVDVTFTQHCEHSDLQEMPNYFVPKEEYRPPTITSLHIRNQQVPLPVCVGQVLRARCKGVLRRLIFEQYPKLDNVMMTPDPQVMGNILSQIAQDSRATLEYLQFTKNSTDADVSLMTNISNPHEAIHPRLALREVFFQENSHRWIQPVPPSIGQSILHLLNNEGLRETLTTVHIGFPFQVPFYTALRAALEQLRSLRVFKLGLIYHNTNYNIVDLLTGLTQVTDFTIADWDFTEGKGKESWRYVNRLNYNYLATIPNNVRALTLSHYWDNESRPMMTNFFSGHNIRNLTKFELFHSTMFNDEMMSLIIQHLRLLQVLKLRYCRMLTDSGLTGFSQDVCGVLLKCPCITDMNGQPTIPPLEQSLIQLNCLKSLDLRGCSRLTDVSLRYAIACPKLEYLNLDHCINISDIGVVTLGRNNPNLKELHLQEMYRVSLFGVNLLIGKNKSVRKIYLSPVCRNNKQGSELYQKHTFLQNILIWKPERDSYLQ